MKNKISRCIQLGDWVFEIKMVRALRVKDYGKPYSAIANLCLNGNQAYIDGLMNKDQHELTEEDYQTLEKFCQQIGIDKVKFASDAFDVAEASHDKATAMLKLA